MVGPGGDQEDRSSRVEGLEGAEAEVGYQKIVFRKVFLEVGDTLP
jgi:hypothetical protein